MKEAKNHQVALCFGRFSIKLQSQSSLAQAQHALSYISNWKAQDLTKQEKETQKKKKKKKQKIPKIRQQKPT